MSRSSFTHSSLTRSAAHRERGAVLVVGLILLLVLTLAGVVLARMQTVEERMARNEDNHQLALQASEAALRDAENQIFNNPQRNMDGGIPGLYTLLPSTPNAADMLIASNWTTMAYPTITYTGPALAGVPLVHPAKYVIEELPAVASGSTSIGSCQYNCGPSPLDFRITVHGFGGDGTATTTLQSVYQYSQ